MGDSAGSRVELTVPTEQPAPGRQPHSARWQIVAAWAVTAVAATSAFAGGGYWLYESRDENSGIEIVIPTPAPVVVQVSGAVMNPGVYELPAGARLQDLLDAAGGPYGNANLDPLNLARLLGDGERVDVPTERAEFTSVGPGSAAPAVDAGGTASNLLDLNTATLAELDALSDLIGPTRAQAIIDYREESGPIERVDDLLEINGIGSRIVDSIRGLVLQP